VHRTYWRTNPSSRARHTHSEPAIAWCAANPRVSTVITGASRPEQVVENMGALTALEQLDADVKREIEQICVR